MQSVHDGSRWMLRLEDGEELFRALSDFADAQQIRAAAVVSGIGMFRSASVGYWNGREYDAAELSGPHEVVGLHGSIAVADGRPSIHLHATLVGADHRAVGGHLLKATVAVVGEILVEAFEGRTFGRPFRESLGLRTLDLDPGPSP